jgi:hypothetical protein
MNILVPAGYLGLGCLGGALYFALLRWNTSLYTRGGRLAPALALQGLRMAAAAGLLLLAARQGALALLLTALGVMLARPLAIRVLR